ncbi:unnamed protein product [Leptosia nina]|uniref:Uncharacterized protein n=1 Tax=Leptosia nina TaxID=320188 RepID=A0AAV1JWQ6_9NEOP
MSPKTTRKANISIDFTNLGDGLTSISCGHIVVELIKFLVYQRTQIPYTYPWLKQLINSKKNSESEKDSYQSERHFFVASTALSNLDFVIKSLLKEIEGAAQPQEVCVAFGATPITCKEMYRLLLPAVCHKLQCHSAHIASDRKIKDTVFRTLVTSDKLYSENIFLETLSPTNMYVFIKKVPMTNQQAVCNDTFVQVTNGYRIPRSCKIITFNFKGGNQEKTACCNDFQIFGDVLNQDLSKMSISDDEFNEIESTDKAIWFQSTYVMKGFKDCVVKDQSITNTWLAS